MKQLIFLIVLIWSGCAGNRVTIKATVRYIEPFPFAYSLGHHAMQNTQAAWIKRVDADDSIAVLFDYSTSGGVDIAKKISSGRVYLFTIEPIDEVPFHTASDRIGKFDSSIARIESLQTRALLDSPLVVKSDIFWRVLSIDKP